MYKIDDIRTEEQDGVFETSARVAFDGKEDRLYFRYPGVACPAPGDAFLASVVYRAMEAGSKIVIDGSVSARLMENLEQIQKIYRCWDYRKQFIDVEVGEIRPAGALDGSLKPGRGVASFFSGGVDSYYTAVENLDRIQDLVLVHGFEIPLRRTDLRRKMSKQLAHAASRLGKPIIEMETNFAQVLTYHDWEFLYGSVLAALGVIISGSYDTVLFAGADSYRCLVPCGTHPLLDPLWSTDTMEVEHHGIEADRVEKLLALADTPVVFETAISGFPNA